MIAYIKPVMIALLAVASSHALNVFAIKYFEGQNLDQNITTLSEFVHAGKIALISSPVLFLSAVFYNWFFIYGIKETSYVGLVVLIMSMSIVFSFIVGWIIKSDFSAQEMLGAGFAAIGIMLTVTAR